MIDILIKSFNRPFYLERCIRSIITHVKGNYKITVIDDGTPPEYLERMEILFPFIKIIKSELYDKKVKAIHDHLSKNNRYENRILPIDTWRSFIKSGSDYFLLLEDDNWIIAPFHISEVVKVMRDCRFIMLTMDWQGNEKFINGKKRIINDLIEETIPNIPLYSRLLFLNQFKFNKLLPVIKKTKLESLFYRIGFFKNEYEIKWPLYTICLFTSTFFEKNYWLYLWDGAPPIWDENYQLKRAGIWFLENKSHYAKSRAPLARTSYISSATNNFKEISFDVFRFNHEINQVWLQGHFDAMENYPGDFSLEYIRQFIDKKDNSKSGYENWLHWIDRFKTQYRNIGAEVDY